MAAARSNRFSFGAQAGHLPVERVQPCGHLPVPGGDRAPGRFRLLTRGRADQDE